MWHGYYGFGGWWMMGFGVLALGGVIALVVWAVMRGSEGARYGRAGLPDDDPMAILKRRYARGEVTREEFERISEDLRPR